MVLIAGLIVLGRGGVASADTQPTYIAYGSNPAAGKTFVFNGTRFYYEAYGEGVPVLLIPANGESIGSFKGQIGDFASHHRVIAMDSRGQGKSELGTAALTYRIPRIWGGLISLRAIAPNVGCSGPAVRDQPTGSIRVILRGSDPLLREPSNLSGS
jgi:hypothetical protein